MAEFTLDTSGYVTARRASSGGPFTFAWHDLSPFVQGYIEALFATEVERGEQRWIAPLSEFARFSDLSPEALALILKDCEAALATKLWGNSVGDGRLFWSERCQECFSGFFGNPQGDALRERFPKLTVSLSGEGKVLLTEAAR